MNEGIPRNSLSLNPINLGVRFLLELCILAALAYWGWNKFSGSLGVLFSVLLPVVGATLWGTFRVPDDPGRATVAIRGWLRLLLELLLFTAANAALFDLQLTTSAWAMLVITVVHYAISYDRIRWLLKR
ncbi:MAG: YrdB family protein [Bacteroidetes bacterium]|nr:YrdB family protein [Bacteroidota bacterium]